MKKLLPIIILFVCNFNTLAQLSKCKDIYLYINAVSIDRQTSVGNEYGDGFRLCQGSTMYLTSNFYSSGQATPTVSYSWILPDGSKSSAEELLLKNLDQKAVGLYTLTAKVSGTCLDTTLILKQNVKIALPDVKLTEGNVCEGADIQLDYQSYNSYPYYDFYEKSKKSFKWNGPNGFTSSEDKPILKNVKEAGVYKATVTFSDFCVGSYELSTKVNIRKESNVATDYDYACIGGTATLKATATVAGALGKYTWKGPNGFLQDGQEINLKNVSQKDAGAYKVIARFEGGCNNTDSTFTTLNIPEPFSLGKFDEFCEGGTVTLPKKSSSYGVYFDDPNTKIAYQWTGPNNFQSNQEAPTISNFTKAKAGNYTLEVTFTGACQTKVTKSIYVSPVDKPYLGLTTYSSSNTFCKGSNVSIYKSYSSSLYSSSTFSWKGPNNFSSTESYLSIQNFDETKAGTYTLTMNTKGCLTSVTSDITIQLATQRKVYISPWNSNEYCKGSTIELDAYPDIYSNNDVYSWTGPNGFKSEDGRIQISNLNEKNSGTYTVTVKSNNCPTVTATTQITLIQMPKINLPHIIEMCEGGFKDIYTTFTPYSYGRNIVAGGHLSESNGITTKYEWTGPNNFKSENQILTLRNFNKNQIGEYEFKATFTGGCEGVASRKVKIIQSTPTIDWAVEKLCNGNILFTPTFSDFSDNTFKNYKIFDANKKEVSNPLDSKSSGVYTVTANLSGGCNLTSQKQIDIKDSKPFQITLPETIEGCIGGQTLSYYPKFGGGWYSGTLDYFDLNYTSSRFSFFWKRPNNTIIRNYSLSLYNLQKSDEGIYKITGTLSGECTGTYEAQTKLIVDAEKPTVNYNLSQDKQTVSFENKTAGRVSNYYWDFGNGQTSEIANPNPITYTSQGNFKISLEASNGCGTNISEQNVTISKQVILANEKEDKLVEFSVSPNPSEELIEISNSSKMNLKLFIYNIEGKVLDEFDMKSNESLKQYNFKNYPSGMYMIKSLSATGQSTTRKVIITR